MRREPTFDGLMVETTYCPNFSKSEHSSLPFAQFSNLLTRSVGYASKEASKARGAFIGGVLKDPKRNRADDNIAARTVATIDFDAINVDILDVELALRANMPCAFVAYSTFRHTPDAPRIRLCVPLSRQVGQDEYRDTVSAIVALLPELGAADKCSWVWAQLMFLASHQHGVEPWSLTVGGDPWQVKGVDTVETLDLTEGQPDDGGLALERAIAYEPLDLTDDAVASLLERWPADPLDYDQWLEVGAALWHQYRGSRDGYSRWVAWSERSPKHDPREMWKKWRSFGGRLRPKTFATLIHRVGRLPTKGSINSGALFSRNPRSNSKGFELIRASELKYQPPQFLIDEILEDQSTVQIFGDPGSGKSFLALDIAASIASGVEFHGRRVKQGSVIYLAGEGHNGIGRRLEAWRRARGQNLVAFEPLFISVRPAQFLDAASIRAVAEAVDRVADNVAVPVLIVVDTLARNFGPGDENSTADMSGFIAALDGLRCKYNCSVLLVHHTGHGEKSRARGSIALKAALDAEFQIEKEGDLVRVKCTKMKDAPPPPIIVFSLKTVLLEQENDVPISSAVLEVSDLSIERQEKISGNSALALETLRSVSARLRARNVDLEDWRREFYLKALGSNEGAKRKAFQRGRERLVKLGIVTFEDNLFAVADLKEEFEEIATS